MTVAFKPACVDATQDQTNVTSFAVLEPKADGLQNLAGGRLAAKAELLLLDRAQLLTLTAPEMTVLSGGSSVLGVTVAGAQHDVLTSRPGALTADFFTNLLDMRTT